MVVGDVALQPDLVVWVTNASALGPVRRIAELSAASTRPFPILALQIDGLDDVLATPRVLAGQLSPADTQAVFRWISLNAEALVAYWEGQIDTVRLIYRLKPLSGQQA